MTDPFALSYSLSEAAEALGVPAFQLARWCADGTIPREHFTGWAGDPASLRLTDEGLDALRDHLTPTE